MTSAKSIRLFRLISGEDIIGEYVSEGADTIIIKNPVRLVVLPNQSDPKTPRVGLGPWCDFTKDKNFSIQKQHVIFIVDPLDEFKNHYNSIFSGIITPEKLIIPGA
jgi:hypothetical protein